MPITKEKIFEFDDELDKLEKNIDFLIERADKEDTIESTIKFLCEGILVYIPHLKTYLSKLLEKIENKKELEVKHNWVWGYKN